MSDASHVWNPPADVRAAGQRANVPHAWAGHTEAGEQRSPYPSLVALSRAIKQAFPFVYEAGMVRPSDRLGAPSNDPHRWGSGSDLMLADTPSRPAQGDALANFLVANAELLGIQYVLWSMYEFSTSGSGQRFERYGDASSPHRDHVHIELSPIAYSWTPEQMQSRFAAAISSQSSMLAGFAAFAGAAGVTAALAWWWLKRR